MRGALIVITGTGTGIGKTHVARALLLAAQSSGPVFGYKPIESGVAENVLTDAEQLAHASTFHVKQMPALRLRAPVSPHLAAELEGVSLDWSTLAAFVEDVRARGVNVLVELAGGLFTPIAPKLRNVDVLAMLDPTTTLLVAPNRLGVLHDVGAALAGATHVGARIDVVGLIATDTPDDSTDTNARELRRFVDVPIAGVWDREPPDALAKSPVTLRVLYTYWLAASTR